MNTLILIESFGSFGTNDDLGLALIMAAPILLLIAFIFLIIGIVKKTNKDKMLRIALISFIVAGVSALVGMGQCGWFN